jgi:hypothetical protein
MRVTANCSDEGDSVPGALGSKEKRVSHPDASTDRAGDCNCDGDGDETAAFCHLGDVDGLGSTTGHHPGSLTAPSTSAIAREGRHASPTSISQHNQTPQYLVPDHFGDGTPSPTGISHVRHSYMHGATCNRCDASHVSRTRARRFRDRVARPRAAPDPRSPRPGYRFRPDAKGSISTRYETHRRWGIGPTHTLEEIDVPTLLHALDSLLSDCTLREQFSQLHHPFGSHIRGDEVPGFCCARRLGVDHHQARSPDELLVHLSHFGLVRPDTHDVRPGGDVHAVEQGFL